MRAEIQKLKEKQSTIRSDIRKREMFLEEMESGQ